MQAKNNIVIRTGKDRLRYTIIFELLLVALLTPLGALIFDRPLTDIGTLAIILSLKAMLINLIYNWFYDKWDVHAGRIPTERSFLGRVFHAVGFELSLMLTSLPIVMWWLGITLLQAIVMDLAVTSIIVVFTMIYTWGYDRLFPVVQPVQTSCV